jgi:hypothetical protein
VDPLEELEDKKAYAKKLKEADAALFKEALKDEEFKKGLVDNLKYKPKPEEIDVPKPDPKLDVEEVRVPWPNPMSSPSPFPSASLSPLYLSPSQVIHSPVCTDLTRSERSISICTVQVPKSR